MIDIKTATMLVKRVITGLPIEIYDDETGEVSSVPDYELCTPRPEGDCAGSREIGSANLIISYNMLYKKLYSKNRVAPKAELTNQSLDLFKDALDHLIEQRIIRMIPELQRQTFKVVD